MFNITISSTGLVYLILFFALGLLTYRFFQYWQREKTVLSMLFLCFIGVLALFMLVTAISGLFFAQNALILKWTVVFASLMQAFSCAIVVFIVIYSKLPKVSPWLISILVFILGLTTTVLAAITPFHPFLDATGGINWDIPVTIEKIRLFMYLIAFLPFAAIIFQQLKNSQDSVVRARSLGLTLGIIFGVIVGLFDFFLDKILKLGAISRDVIMGTIAIILFIVIFITQKPLTPEKSEEKKLTPPSLKVPW